MKTTMKDHFLLKFLKRAPCSIYWKDVNSIYLGCNNFMAKLLGLKSAKDIIGKTDYDLVWCENAKRIQEFDHQVMKAGHAITTEEINKLFNGNFTYLSTKIPLHDERGRITGLFGILVDMTFYKQYELSGNTKESIETTNQEKSSVFAVKKNEITREIITKNKATEEYTKNKLTYLENIIACMPGNIYWMDRNCVYLGCNDNVAKVLGLKSIKEIIGKSYKEFARIAGWKDDQAESFMKDDLEVMASGLPKYNVEEPPLPDLDGNLLYYLTTRVPLKDTEGNVTGVVGVSIDITDRKRMEEELKHEKERAEIANQAKSNFLATVSHELRTPLNAIMGMAQILNSKNLTAEQKEYVNVISLSGKNLLALINDILDFSKLEAEKLVIRTEFFDLNALVDEIKISMLHLVEDKGMNLLVEHDLNVPKVVMGDSLRVRQIIVNLLGNAIKFTEAGQIKLRIKCEAKTSSGIWVRIIVEDTGIGISKDKLATIFERFTQVESHYSRRFGGVGLGLAICKQLVNAMGGHISVTSEVEKGSQFCFTIPLKLPTATKMSIPALDENEVDLENLPKIDAKILLVEDNILNQKIAKIMLEEFGCKIDIAENGLQAIEMFNKNHYDFIFMDVGLPDMDGLQVIRRIRKLEDNKKHLPIIAMTAHVLEEDRINCLKAGADDVITKPVMQHDLYSIIKKWSIDKKSQIGT